MGSLGNSGLPDHRLRMGHAAGLTSSTGVDWTDVVEATRYLNKYRHLPLAGIDALDNMFETSTPRPYDPNEMTWDGSPPDEPDLSVFVFPSKNPLKLDKPYLHTFDALGAYIHYRRLEALIPLEVLAKHIGVAPRFIWELEKGQPRPEQTVILQLLLALNVQAEALPHAWVGRWSERLSDCREGLMSAPFTKTLPPEPSTRWLVTPEQLVKEWQSEVVHVDRPLPGSVSPVYGNGASSGDVVSDSLSDEAKKLEKEEDLRWPL